jgi:hypothetical protein
MICGNVVGPPMCSITAVLLRSYRSEQAHRPSTGRGGALS